MKITMGIRVNFQTILRSVVGYVLVNISSSNIFLNKAFMRITLGIRVTLQNI